MSAFLVVPTVLAFALADAPRSAALLQEPAPAPAASPAAAHATTPPAVQEATPIVENAPGQATPVVEHAATPIDGAPPSATALASATSAKRSVMDAQPWRPWLGGIVGGVGVLGGAGAGLALAVQGLMPTLRNDSIGVGGFVLLLYAAAGALVGSWVVGPLAASLAMGGWRVPLRVLGYTLLGLGLGIASAIVPVVGLFTLLAGPTIGAVYAVATADAEDFAEPARALGAPAPGPLLSFTF